MSSEVTDFVEFVAMRYVACSISDYTIEDLGSFIEEEDFLKILNLKK